MRKFFALGKICILAAAAGLTFITSHPARAACGAGDAKAGYSITIQGDLASGGTEALAGVIQLYGNCTLTGTFYGNINGSPISAATATGTYEVNAELSGDLTLAISDEAARTFTINVVNRRKEIVGIENDGAAYASIDARAQISRSFGITDLNGAYSWFCILPAIQQAQMALFEYDGSGSGTFTNSGYFGSTNGTSTYAVNSDGTVVLTNTDVTGNVFLWGGGLDSSNSEVQFAAISGPAQPPALCVTQKQ